MISNDVDAISQLESIVRPDKPKAEPPVSVLEAPAQGTSGLGDDRQVQKDNEEKAQRLNEIIEDNRAIREGLQKAQQRAVDVSSSLAKIEQQLDRSKGLGLEATASNLSASRREKLSLEFSKELSEIDRLSEELASGASEEGGSAIGGFLDTEVAATTSAALGLGQTSLESSQSASESLQALEKASEELRAKQSISSGLVNHLESQMVALDEAIATGSRALSTFTNGDLLLKASSNSQLDSEIFTSVLVQQEALQQNRWVGRVLNQLK